MWFQAGISTIPLAGCRCVSGILQQGSAQKTSRGKCPNQKLEPSQLSDFNEEQVYSKLLLDLGVFKVHTLLGHG